MEDQSDKKEGNYLGYPKWHPASTKENVDLYDKVQKSDKQLHLEPDFDVSTKSSNLCKDVFQKLKQMEVQATWTTPLIHFFHLAYY